MTKISRRAMDARRGMRRKGDSEESGFTVIELLIVLLILGVLVAIGIPTYYAIRSEQTDGTAQNNVTTALGAANLFAKSNNGLYIGLCPGNAKVDPNCGVPSKFNHHRAQGYAATHSPVPATNNLPSPNASTVSIDIVNGGADIIVAALATGTGNCWAIIQINQPGHPTDTTAATFTGTIRAVYPKSQLGTLKCKAGLFDNGNLRGNPPTTCPLPPPKAAPPPKGAPPPKKKKPAAARPHCDAGWPSP